MDLSETYRSIARKYFPSATIVADRFHVVRLINQHFLKVWQLHDPEGRQNRGLISLMLSKIVTAKRARKKLPQLAELLDQLRDSPLRVLARTLTSWLEPIIAMWRFSKSNGITKGFHNKMEMISRRAYGFRNFENYRLRVLTHCGWDGIINRVRMDARPPIMG